jgi:hypothetical protein
MWHQASNYARAKQSDVRFNRQADDKLIHRPYLAQHHNRMLSAWHMTGRFDDVSALPRQRMMAELVLSGMLREVPTTNLGPQGSACF